MGIIHERDNWQPDSNENEGILMILKIYHSLIDSFILSNVHHLMSYFLNISWLLFIELKCVLLNVLSSEFDQQRNHSLIEISKVEITPDDSTFITLATRDIHSTQPY